MSEDKEDEQGLHRPVTPEGSDQVDFGDPGMAGHALIEMGVPGSPRLPLKKKLISEVTAENLSCRFRIERRYRLLLIVRVVSQLLSCHEA